MHLSFSYISITQVRVRRTEVLQSARSMGNPELKYYSNWETGDAGAGAGGMMDPMDEFGGFVDNGPTGGGGYAKNSYAKGGGAGGASSSSYQRKGGASSSYGGGAGGAKKKWTPAGGGAATNNARAPGGYAGVGGPPPPFEEIEEYDVDTDIPF